MNAAGKAVLPPCELEGTSELAGALRHTRREVTSTELFAGGRELHILHAQEIYTLRQTNKGKLILTK